MFQYGPQNLQIYRFHASVKYDAKLVGVGWTQAHTLLDGVVGFLPSHFSHLLFVVCVSSSTCSVLLVLLVPTSSY